MMNKFLHTTGKAMGITLNVSAIIVVRTLQVTVVGVSLFADWAAPRLESLHEKLM
jgi:hypothetical protein